MSDLLSLNALLALALGYLLGSIPFGVILTRIAGLGDIRQIGSGNIGATNVLRTGNKPLAAATLLGDGLKGTAAVLLAGWLFDMPLAPAVAGLGAFLGHCFPVWLGFRGGKGVATYIGVLIGLAWPAALVLALVWLAMALVARISSLAALTASLTVPFSLLVMGRVGLAVFGAVLTALLWIRHTENIRRLASGTESRIGDSRK